MCVLAGIVTAGVPGGSLPLVVVVLHRSACGRVDRHHLGVDRLLDMCRTTLNVTGDIAVAACVDRSDAAGRTRRAAQGVRTDCGG